MREKVAVIYNEPLPGRYHSLGEGGAVAGVLDAVASVCQALNALEYEVQVLALKPPLSKIKNQKSNIKEELKQLSVDIVFNLFEGFDDSSESEAEVAYLLKKMRVCFSGSPGHALLLSQNKAVAKQVLRQHSIPTPDWQVLSPENVILPLNEVKGKNLHFGLTFPCIIKPLNTHASHGLSEKSVVEDFPALAKQASFIHRAYGQPALVEEFLPGREFCALIMGNGHPRIYPIEEIIYTLPPDKPRILAYPAKWDSQDDYFRGTKVRCPAEVSPELKQEIETLALHSFLVFGCRGYARVDVRQDKEGRIKVLDVNPNPDIGSEGGARQQTEAAGLDYPAFIGEILSLAKEAFLKVNSKHQILNNIEN